MLLGSVRSDMFNDCFSRLASWHVGDLLALSSALQGTQAAVLLPRRRSVVRASFSPWLKNKLFLFSLKCERFKIPFKILFNSHFTFKFSWI